MRPIRSGHLVERCASPVVGVDLLDDFHVPPRGRAADMARGFEIVGAKGQREERELVVDEVTDLIDRRGNRVAIRIDLRLEALGRTQRIHQQTDALLAREAARIRLRRRDPQRWVRSLQRARQHRDLVVPPVELALVGHVFFGPKPRQKLDRLFPLLSGGRNVGAEGFELVGATRATGAHLEAAIAQDVDHCSTFGDAYRMIHRTWQQRHAVTKPDPRGSLRQRAQHHLRRRRVRELLQEMVLDHPHRVEAHLLGEHRLLERLIELVALLTFGPRPGNLHLEEQVEPESLHCPPPRE